MTNILKEIKVSIKNPGNLFLSHPRARRFYNDLCDRILAQKHKRRNEIAGRLANPHPQLRIPPEEGFRIVPVPLNCPTVEPLLRRCRQIMADPSKARPKVGKSYLNHLVSPQDLGDLPEFTDFALNHDLLSIVVDYLGELPLVGGIHFWHAHTSSGPWGKSQLYHSDFDDIRQVKVFVFVNDIDMNSGPLTIIPAQISEEIRRKLNNNNNRYGEYISDERIRPLIPPGAEISLTGPSGTTAFVDTSKVLHYGSRVANRDRYMVVIQYLSITNFVYNSLYRFDPYPYAHLVKPQHSEIQKAVLDPT